MAEEKEKRAQEEHRRQAQIERDLQRDLSRRTAYEREKESRTKEAKAYWARSRIKTQSEIEQKLALGLERLCPRAAATCRGRQPVLLNTPSAVHSRVLALARAWLLSLGRTCTPADSTEPGRTPRRLAP